MVEMKGCHWTCAFKRRSISSDIFLIKPIQIFILYPLYCVLHISNEKLFQLAMVLINITVIRFNHNFILDKSFQKLIIWCTGQVGKQYNYVWYGVYLSNQPFLIYRNCIMFDPKEPMRVTLTLRMGNIMTHK